MEKTALSIIFIILMGCQSCGPYIKPINLPEQALQYVLVRDGLEVGISCKGDKWKK